MSLAIDTTDTIDTRDTRDTNDTNLFGSLLGPRCPRCLLRSCREWIGWWQRRRAVGAARSHEWNAAQAIRAIARSGRRLHFLWLETSHQRVYRQHNQKVDDGSHDQEAKDRVEESAYRKLPPMINSDCQAGQGLIARNRDERRDNTPNEGLYNASEGGAYHEADCQIHYVAAQDECSKSTQQIPSTFLHSVHGEVIPHSHR